MDWIYPCGSGWSYCKDGFCGRYNQLKEENKHPAVEMSKEWLETTGKEWKPGAIRKQFLKLTVTKGNDDSEPKDYETCAVSDLYSLINNGKTYSTIYADPPWKYSNQATRSSTDNHYKTMTVEDIANLPISKLTTENAHLHLWTTNAFLFEAKQIIEAWGFEYKSCFVWVKPQMGIGNYWRVSHEFLLFGLKGKQPFMDRSQMSWIQIDRTKHSSKPEEIAQTIELVSPGPYIELFGRKTRNGWTVWGDEIAKDLFNKSAFGQFI